MDEVVGNGQYWPSGHTTPLTAPAPDTEQIRPWQFHWLPDPKQTPPDVEEPPPSADSPQPASVDVAIRASINPFNVIIKNLRSQSQNATAMRRKQSILFGKTKPTAHRQSHPNLLAAMVAVNFE